MRVGLIGCGNISDTHARAALSIPGVELVALYGPSADKVRRLAALYGGRVYTDLPAFLDHHPMDVVAIGSPSGAHAGQAIDAARRGLHVLVEKPLDISTDRIDRLIEEVDRAGVRLGVFFQDRFAPDVVALRRLLATGALGRPILASGRVKWHRPPEYYRDSRWRGTWGGDGGGALMNQGIHTVDLLLWLLGPVSRVGAAVTTGLHDIEVEDTAVAMLEFASGAIGTIEATTAAYPGFPRRVEVTGTRGTATLEQDRLVSVDVQGQGAAGAWRPAAAGEPGSAPAAATSPVVADVTPHRRVFEDFFRAIKDGTEPRCDAREGRRSVALVQAVYESARSRRIVGL